jgi:uncharacterized protein (DUF111 family)
MLVAGLTSLLDLSKRELEDFVSALGLKELKASIKLEKKSLNHIGGLTLKVDFPIERQHRTLAEIKAFFSKADLSQNAKSLALEAFEILAKAEGQVHDIKPEEVSFHEVGALDSLLDIGLAAALFDKLKPSAFICGPLPICDGVIECAHGLLPSPAPAVATLLEGTMVTGLNSRGETVTPTGLSLLKAFGAEFGPWPEMVVVKQTLIYGSRELPGVPNGALFVYGALVS